MCLYLEFARRLPYTGGELIYVCTPPPLSSKSCTDGFQLDCIWRRRPRLLLYTWYTIYFVTLYTTCSNSLQFAKQVLIAADVGDPSPDRRLICFIAFTVTSAVCLLLYFDSQTSRYVNSGTALAKVILLLVVLGAGCQYLRTHSIDPKPWSEASRTVNEPDRFQGLLLVFFSYHGWENATFVSDHQSPSTQNHN